MKNYQPVLELLRMKTKESMKSLFLDNETVSEINLESFCLFLTKKLELNLKQSDIQILFHQLDPYSKGFVTFESLDKYLEIYEDRRNLKTVKPFHATPSIHPGVKSQDSIFEFAAYADLKDSNKEIAGHYVSLSRNGLLTIWRTDITKRFERTVMVSHDREKVTTMTTGLACIPRYKLIAVSTASGDIRFFSSNVHKCQHMFSIAWMPSIVMNLSCHESEKLLCGGFDGEVYIINMSEIFFQKLRRRADHLGPQEIVFEDIRKEKVIGLNFKPTKKCHFAPVVKVKYIPSIRAVISCCVLRKRSMLIQYIDRNESLSFSSEGGITCFDFCERLNCVATGGNDHTVKIWNPLINVSSSETLSGHFAPITHVIIDNRRLFLISADRDKTIRVWDMLRPVCLQILKFKDTDFPRKQNFSHIFLDSDIDQLIITTNRIAVLKFFESKHRTVAHPDCELIFLADYSVPYDCIITVGSNSSVAVWSNETNDLIYEFDKIHFTKDELGIAEIMHLTAACLEPTGKRLITAGRDGSVKVWNFYLGICLRSFQSHFIVLSLSSVGFKIFAGGSSGQVTTFYDDGKDTATGAEWKILNKHSVVSMSSYANNILATASSDGEIIIWLWKNADAKLRMTDETEEPNSRNDEDNDYLAKSTAEKRKRCGINQILFLQSRQMEPSVGNLVSCGVDGRIRFWNVISTNKINHCQLLSKFKAVFRQYDAIVCVETDRRNTLLFAGDTLGYLRTYDLEDYYSSFGSVPACAEENQCHMNFYPFLRLQKLIEKNHGQNSKFDSKGAAEFGHAPSLLNCYRTHLGPILRISYCNEKMTVATAGRKGSIRVWTLAGAFIKELSSNKESPSNLFARRDIMPQDIKAVASALTLQVLNSGRKPHWDRGLQAIRRCRLFHASEKREQVPLQWMKQKYIRKEKAFHNDFDLHQKFE